MVGCLVLAAATFLLIAAPVNLVRDRLIEQVRSRTGRDLMVAGPTSLALLPRPAITLANVVLSAPPEMGGAPTLTVQTLEAQVGLLALLTGQAGVERVVLKQPAIELHVDAAGRRSWDLGRPSGEPSAATSRGSATSAPSSAPEQGTGSSASRAPGTAAALDTLGPIFVRVVDGSIRYVDERSGVRQEMEALALDLALRDGASPLEIKGSLDWRGEKVAFAGTLSDLRAVLEDQRARLSLKLAGRPAEASYDGAVAAGPQGLSVEGNMRLEAASLQAFGAWLGRPVATGRDAGALSVTSSLAGGRDRLSLANLNATVGGTSITGDLTIENGAARPHVAGALRLSRLDLGGVLIQPASSARGRPAKATPSGARPADPIDDILRRNGAPAETPQARERGAGWSDDLIDLTPLGLADADLDLLADALIYKDVKTGPTRLSLQLKNTIARLSLEEMQLYGGRGRGLLTLDGSGQTPATGVDLKLDGVSVQPLLKDALGFEWLEGQGNLTIGLTGQGASERQIVETLRGKVDLATTRGAIDAIDVTKILRGLEQGRLPTLRIAAGEKTSFSELAGTFTIANGIADNQDLRLVSPNLRVAGAGSFNLSARTLDYTVRPKIALNTSTERAVINVSNVEIPVRIEGPWEKPNITVAGQEQILETVKEIGKNLKSKDVEDALKGLLGGGKPRDVLDKLFKKQ